MECISAFWLALAVFVGPEVASADSAAELKVGFGQSDITPPVGAIMTGAGHIRSVGVDDRLMARALVAQSGGRKIAIVSVDLVKIRFDLSDAAIALASRRTGISRDAVMICATHNHSSPLIPMKGPTNKDYLSALPARIAESIERACKAMKPARMFLGRSLVFEGLHNRRVVSKADGLVLNTWLRKLNDLKQVPQVLGTEGPIDPELWVARFDGPDGRVLGVLVNFACHPNLHDRRAGKWSADYPGVIADQVARAYGNQVVSVFTQGCSGNVNPNVQFITDWRERADVFARAAVAAARRAIPVEGPILVGYARREVAVPWREPADQRPGAVARLGWRRSIGGVAPERRRVPVNAARIGPLGIVTNAGELFVEWGISIKKRSPFPHTIVCELTNGWMGYEPTAQGFQHEGYEALAGVNFVTLEGIRELVGTGVELLQGLWKGGSLRSHQPKPSPEDWGCETLQRE